MRLLRRNRVAIMAIIAATLAGCAAPNPGIDTGVPTEATVVRVAAAADLKFALEDVAELLQADRPDIRLAITYGSSGTFLQQISNGAPFDLYLSADLDYPRRLVDAGHAAEEDLFSYAVGRLVLWAPEGSAIDPGDGLNVLTEPGIRRIAIANPEHAPYGRAAVSAMQSAGIYEAVKDKLVLGENVAQAAEFVQSGNADVGIVAMSLVLADPLQDSGHWAEVPLDAFPRMEQGGVVLAGAANVEAARTVRDTLLSEPGRELLKRYGFYEASD